MQLLWSRVAQSRSSCSCRSCLNAATSIARRTSTAASKRGLKFGDIFTAAYSAILATAAVADSNFKDKRRREWDRLIEEAKAGKTPNRIEDVNQSSPSTEVPEGKALNTKSSRNVHTGTATVTPAAVWGDNFWTSHAHTGSTHFGNQLSVLDTHLEESRNSRAEPASAHYVDMSEWLDGDDPAGLLPPREYSLHMENMERAMKALVTQILLTMKNQFPDGTKGTSISLQTRQMAERIEALQAGGTQLPYFRWRSLQEVEDERARLHTSLVAIFESAKSNASSIVSAIVKICYNLIVSTVPPSIFTYNILVRIFTLMEQYELGELVIQTFFKASKSKPNPATVRIFLEFYTAKGDAAGFMKIVGAMSGMTGSMKIKRREVKLLQDPQLVTWSAPIMEWAMTTKVIHRGKYLNQKFPRNERIFDALSIGSKKLLGLAHAIRYCKAAIREGQRVRSTTLLDLINTCLRKRNTSQARRLLYAILSEWEKDVNSCFMAIDYHLDIRRAIYALLSRCGCNPSLPCEVWYIRKDSWNSLSLMLNHMSIRALTDDVSRFSANLLTLHNIFGIGPSDGEYCIEDISKYHSSENSSAQVASPLLQGGTWERIDLALNTLKDYTVQAQVRTGQRGSDAISRLDISIQFHSEVIGTMQRDLVSLFYCKLPKVKKQRYEILRCSQSLASQLQIISILHKEAIDTRLRREEYDLDREEGFSRLKEAFLRREKAALRRRSLLSKEKVVDNKIGRPTKETVARAPAIGTNKMASLQRKKASLRRKASLSQGLVVIGDYSSLSIPDRPITRPPSFWVHAPWISPRSSALSAQSHDTR